MLSSVVLVFCFSLAAMKFFVYCAFEWESLWELRKVLLLNAWIGEGLESCTCIQFCLRSHVDLRRLVKTVSAHPDNITGQCWYQWSFLTKCKSANHWVCQFLCQLSNKHTNTTCLICSFCWPIAALYRVP